jgi:RNA polymerase sigma factor (sigma-70 family)
MNRADEEALVLRAQAGDESAREAIVAAFARTCRSEAVDHPMRTLDVDDREQECRISLLKSIDTYSPLAGVKFSHYAKTNMRRRLIDLFRADGRMSRKETVSLQLEVGESELKLEEIIALPETDEGAESRLQVSLLLTAVAEELTSIYRAMFDGTEPASGEVLYAMEAFLHDLEVAGAASPLAVCSVRGLLTRLSPQGSLFDESEGLDPRLVAVAREKFILRLVETQVHLAVAFSEGEDVREVSERLGLDPTTVQLLQRALVVVREFEGVWSMEAA